MKQHALYAPIEAWLQDRGFRVMVTGGKKDFVIPVSDLFAGGFKIPDLVGFSDSNQVVIVEVEIDKEKFFEALGKCMLWRCMATFVYLVYPRNKIGRASFLSKVGIGLLEIDEESHAVKELVALPPADGVLWSLVELHPTDPVKEQQLAAHVRSSLR